MWKFSNDWIVPMVVMMHTVKNLRNESNTFSLIEVSNLKNKWQFQIWSKVLSKKDVLPVSVILLIFIQLNLKLMIWSMVHGPFYSVFVLQIVSC